MERNFKIKREHKTVFNICIDKSLAEKVIKEAERRNIAISRVFNESIKQYIKNK